jgi:DNA-binding GntR family transcriptional regulator
MLGAHESIDFNSNIPYYIQLIELIKGKINRGEWKPGQQILSEPELCEVFQVSRTVVRQALREIELEGLVVRKKGKGTFIAEPKIDESLAQKLTGFYHDMIERGLNPVTQVLRQAVILADKKVAEALKLAPETQVIVMTRLRSVNGEPIVLVTSYLPYSLCPQVEEADFSNQSLYDFLENVCGLLIASGRRTIEAVKASGTEAKLLQVDECDPLLRLESVSLLENGTPIEYYIALHRGDRSRFEVELVRVRELGDLRTPIFPLDNLPNSN